MIRLDKADDPFIALPNKSDSWEIKAGVKTVPYSFQQLCFCYIYFLYEENRF